MGEPYSLLAMNMSAEKQTFDHDWYRGRNRQKMAKTWWIFLTTDTSYLQFFHHRLKTHRELPFSGQRVNTHNGLLFLCLRVKTCNLVYERNPNSKAILRKEPREKRKTSFEWTSLRGMVRLVKQIPKERTCPRGKRQLLILVLSEIRRVSFYQRVMKTQ